MARLVTAALVGALLLAGCSTRSDLERMEETMIAEFRELNERQDSLAREVRELRSVVLDSLSAREGDALGMRGELSRRLGQLQEELGRVAALTGQNLETLERLRRQMAAGGGQGAAAGGAGDDAGAVGPDSAATGDSAAAGGGAAEQLYRTALEQFRRGSLGTARAGLGEFLSQHPDHDLAPDAQYYVAETYARADRPSEALEAYGRVVELFPGSRRAATALYKSGVLEVQRGNLEDARVYFSRVVKGYPESDEADLARDRLDDLSGDGG